MSNSMHFEMQSTAAFTSCTLGITICSASVILNIWIFFVLRHQRSATTSGSPVSESGCRIYNLELIRHLLVTDVLTAVLVVSDLSLKMQNKPGSVAAPLVNVTGSVSYNISNPVVPIPPLPVPSASLLTGPPILPPLPKITSLLNLNQSLNKIPTKMYGYSCLSYFTKQFLYSSHALTLIALTLIAIDLYIFVVRALSYRRALIVRCLPRLLLVSWFTWLLLALLPQLCCVGEQQVDFYSLQIVLVVFIASCCVVTFCYARIVHTICRLAASAPGAAATSMATAARHNVRGVATSVGLLLMFYALFLPYFTLLLRTTIANFAGDLIDVLLDSEQQSYYLEVVMATYTLFNPLVYACRLRAVRRRSSRTLAILGRRRTRNSARHLNLMPDSANVVANNLQSLARSPASQYGSRATGPVPTRRERLQRQSLFPLSLPSKSTAQPQEEDSAELHELRPL